MNILKCNKLVSTIAIVAMVASILILPSDNSTVYATGTPQVKFSADSKITIEKGSLYYIQFRSENITATSAAVSATSSSGSVKVYDTIVYPGDTAGFSGIVTIKAITAGKSANLKISVPGDTSISGDVITVNVNGYYVGLTISNPKSTEDTQNIYLQRGKTASISVYNRTYVRGGFYTSDFYVPSTEFTWNTSNKKIATVSNKGVVKVNKKAPYGKYATITIATKKKDKKTAFTAKYRVYVKKKSGKVTKLNHDGYRTRYMPVVGTRLLRYYYDEDTISKNGAYPKATWSSSDKSVLTVDSRGMVTAKSPGIARVTVKVGKKKLTYTMKVLSIPDFIEWYDIWRNSNSFPYDHDDYIN